LAIGTVHRKVRKEKEIAESELVGGPIGRRRLNAGYTRIISK
jgi:hypothetical protein